MTFEEYWQDNKRFVGGALGGIVLLFAANAVVDSVWGDELRATRAQVRGLERKLREPLFDASDLERAQAENAALVEALGLLQDKAGFVPRERFGIDPELGSPANQYRRVFSEVEEGLSRRANRANLRFDATLGMPKLSPTREGEIVRYLEALDLVEQVLGYAIDAGCDRVERIQVRLDPGLESSRGVDRIERTRVSFTVVGDSLAVTRVLVWSQRPPGGQRVLSLAEVEVVASRTHSEQVRADLTFLIPRPASWSKEAGA